MNNSYNIDQVLDFIDNFIVNTYFANLDVYEEKHQKEIKSLRFKMNNAKHSSAKKVSENYKKQLENKENELFYEAALKMNEIKKNSISGLIFVLNPFLTFYNENFANYLIESDIEDKNLLSFLAIE